MFWDHFPWRIYEAFASCCFPGSLPRNLDGAGGIVMIWTSKIWKPPYFPFYSQISRCSTTKSEVALWCFPTAPQKWWLIEIHQPVPFQKWMGYQTLPTWQLSVEFTTLSQFQCLNHHVQKLNCHFLSLLYSKLSHKCKGFLKPSWSPMASRIGLAMRWHRTRCGDDLSWCGLLNIAIYVWWSPAIYIYIYTHRLYHSWSYFDMILYCLYFFDAWLDGHILFWAIESCLYSTTFIINHINQSYTIQHHMSIIHDLHMILWWWSRFTRTPFTWATWTL